MKNCQFGESEKPVALKGMAKFLSNSPNPLLGYI